LKIYVLENAFWNLLLSSVEVYPKECLGLVIGALNDDVSVIHHAVTFQTANRRRRDVEFPRHSVHRNVRSLLEEFLPHQRIVGDFHSHTTARADKLSPEDLATMEEGQVYVIIEVNKKRKSVPWRYNSTQTLLSGTTRQFFFRIAAWYKAPDDKRFRLAQLICQVSPGLSG